MLYTPLADDISSVLSAIKAATGKYWTPPVRVRMTGSAHIRPDDDAITSKVASVWSYTTEVSFAGGLVLSITTTSSSERRRIATLSPARSG